MTNLIVSFVYSLKRSLQVSLFACCFVATVNAQSPQEMLSKAAAATDIYSKGPFFLKAKVEVTAVNKVSGYYKLAWVNERIWHDELSLDTYIEGRSGWQGKVSYTRNQDWPTWLVEDVRNLVGFQALFHPRKETEFTSVRTAKVDDVKVQCFVEKLSVLGDDLKHEVCFDPNVGAYIGNSDKTHYTDFRQFNGALFPYHWHTESGSVKIDIAIEELRTIQPPPDSLFQLNNLTAAEGCYAPVPARLRKFVQPDYGQIAKTVLHSITAKTNVVIGADGHVSKADPGSGNWAPTVNMKKNIVDAAAHWEFDPALCGDKPVRSEDVVYVGFTQILGRK